MGGKVWSADTAGYALKFGAVTIPSALRVGWFPMLLGLVAAYQLQSAGVDDGGTTAAFAGMDSNGAFQFDWDALLADDEISDFFAFGTGLILLFVSTIMSVPLLVLWTRQSAGQVDAPGGIFYFQWTGREWRTLAMALFYIPWFLILGLAVVAPGLIYAFVTGDLTMGEGGKLLGEPSVVSYVLWGGGGLALIWATIRSSLFVAVAAIENRFAPLYAFGQTGGHFWSILGSAILFGLGLAIVMIPLSLGIGGFAAASFTGMGIMGIALSFALLGLLELFSNLASFAFSGHIWLSLNPTAQMGDDAPTASMAAADQADGAKDDVDTPDVPTDPWAPSS